MRLAEIDLHKIIDTSINQKNELNGEIENICKQNSIISNTLDVTQRDI